MFRFAERRLGLKETVQIGSNSEEFPGGPGIRYSRLIYYLPVCPYCNKKNIYVPGRTELTELCDHFVGRNHSVTNGFDFCESLESTQPKRVVMPGLGI